MLVYVAAALPPSEVFVFRKTGSVKSVNMFSALLHVSADFLRSTSTLIMSLLILLCKVDSTCIDAYTSVFIGITIISGAFVGFFKSLSVARNVLRKRKKKLTNIGQ